MTVEKKSVPMRMCVVCRNMIPKKELLRIVRGTDGKYFFDPPFKANRRGEYLRDKPECMEKRLKKRMMHHAFRTQIPDEVYQALSEEYENRKNP